MRIHKPLLIAAVLFAALALPCAAQIPSAVCSTDINGSTLFGGSYRFEQDVFLYAGPQPGTSCSGLGLPDGTYYFQVTSSSGDRLLSTDPITNREIVVFGGAIVGTTGTHQLVTVACGSKIVQLWPFRGSDGDCRLWVTPTRDYDPHSPGGFYGFRPECSRTESFVVQPVQTGLNPAIIQGNVFFDYNNNGVKDPGTTPPEVDIAGWRVELHLNGVQQAVTFTDMLGKYEFVVPVNGATYDIISIAPPGGFIPNPGGDWLATNRVTGSATADDDGIIPGPEFGNVSFELATGVGRSKGFWHNMNGDALLAPCDPAWRDALNGTAMDPVCLRMPVSTANPAMSIFTVPTGVSHDEAFRELSAYLVLPADGHAAYQLSRQLAATLLNNTCGFMQGLIFVDLTLTQTLQPLESLVQGAVQLLCHPLAGLTGPMDGPAFVSAGGTLQEFLDLRLAFQNCTNEFEVINVTGTLTEPQVVHERTDSPKMFTSPYGDP